MKSFEDYMRATAENIMRFMRVPIRVLKLKQEKLMRQGLVKRAEGMQEAIKYLEDFFATGDDVIEKVIKGKLQEIEQACAFETMDATGDPSNKLN